MKTCITKWFLINESGFLVEAIHGVVYISFVEDAEHALNFGSEQSARDWVKVLEDMSSEELSVTCEKREVNLPESAV